MNYKNICLVLLITAAPQLSAVADAFNPLEWAYGLTAGCLVAGIAAGAAVGNGIAQASTKTEANKEKNKKWGAIIGGTLGGVIVVLCGYLGCLTTTAAQLIEIERFAEKDPEDLSTDQEIKEFQNKASKFKDKLSDMRKNLTGEMKERAKKSYEKLRNLHARARALRNNNS